MCLGHCCEKDSEALRDSESCIWQIYYKQKTQQLADSVEWQKRSPCTAFSFAISPNVVALASLKDQEEVQIDKSSRRHQRERERFSYGKKDIVYFSFLSLSLLLPERAIPFASESKKMLFIRLLGFDICTARRLCIAILSLGAASVHERRNERASSSSSLYSSTRKEKEQIANCTI